MTLGGRIAVTAAGWVFFCLAPAAMPGPPIAQAAPPSDRDSSATATDSATEPTAIDPRHLGGEPDGVVQVANLVYAGTRSSKCFSDYFLIQAEKDTTISTSRRFHSVKLGSEDLYGFPMVIMTGEGPFELSAAERSNLRRYIERGGFLLASAGCSSAEWDRSFRREMAEIFPEYPLGPIDFDHPIFHTVHDIENLSASHGSPRPLAGLYLGGRLGVVYSEDGLNDTAHTEGCCCCGGNEISNAVDITVNILAYALTF